MKELFELLSTRPSNQTCSDSPGALWIIFMLFCRLLIFFKINFLQKFFQEYNISAKQIWVQCVCKGYQQMALGGKECKERNKLTTAQLKSAEGRL